MSQSAVGSVLQSVGNLAAQETTYLWGVTREVEFLKDELVRLQAYLKDMDEKRRSGNARVAALVSQIRDASFDAQMVIEAAEYVKRRNRLKQGFLGAVSRLTHLPSDLISLHKTGSEIQRIRRKLTEIFDSAERMEINLDSSPALNSQISPDFTLLDQKSEDDIEMVGFHDEYKEMTEHLVHGGSLLSVVSILAMGGAGKTTLARKLYISAAVRKHFSTVAWVTISQNFKCLDILKHVMCQFVGGQVESVDEMEEYELGKKISEYLAEKKYLLALDDVWEDDTWEKLNNLVRAFPDGNNGSRVLLTTRKENVATHLEMPTHLHVLKGLDEERSWELFSSKALPPYRRSMLADEAEFEELGRVLAKRCDGLPLALAVLGGYLSHNLNKETWLDVLSCWPVTKKTQLMQSILARSYFDIADYYLRSCFIYLSVFAEDRKIDINVLITLWIAEGLIPHSRKYEQEETARKFVAELAQRSLLQVTARSAAHGWIAQIRVHDVLRDWCIEEARKDGFLDVFDQNSSGQGDAPSSNIMTPYRSCYQNCSAEKLHVSPNLRALFGFDIFGIINLPTLRFLRVLHMENADLQNFPSAIEVCIFLRCLRLVRCLGVTIPRSIGRMLYLQTLDLTRTRLYEGLPDSIWDIPSLRHLFLPLRFSLRRPVKQKELQTLWVEGIVQIGYANESIKQRAMHNMIRFLGVMTKLKTLHLELFDQSITAEVMNAIASMPLLVELYLSQVSETDKLPESSIFPQGLRAFHLQSTGIKEDPLRVLEKLPCLVELKLSGYTGQTMNCSARGFPHLQVLEIDIPEVEQWKIEFGAMPRLSRILLKQLRRLRILPEGLLHLPSLTLLETGFSFRVRDDTTAKELARKGCEVRHITHWPPGVR